MVCQVGSGGCFGIGECMPWARRTYGLHVASLPWVGGTGQDGTDGEGDSVEGHDLPSFPRGYPLDLPPPGMQGVPGLAPGLPPATRQDAWAWFGLAIGGFFGGQLLSGVVLLAVADATGRTRELRRAIPPGWVVVVGLVMLWVGFLGAVALASRRRGTGHIGHDMRLGIRPWDFVVGPLVGVAGQVLLIPLLYIPLRYAIPHLDRRLGEPARHLTGGFHGPTLAVIGVLTVLVVPVVEELFFRGLVLGSMLRLFGNAGRSLGPALAVVVTGILFGLAHFEPLQFLGLAAFGIVLSMLAYKTGRLGPGILAHASFNLVAILAIAVTGTLR